MTQNIFEEIKHINEYGNEFWKAREFYKILEYSEY
jgi:DNA-damage-inducible protein D